MEKPEVVFIVDDEASAKSGFVRGVFAWLKAAFSHIIRLFKRILQYALCIWVVLAAIHFLRRIACAVPHGKSRACDIENKPLQRAVFLPIALTRAVTKSILNVFSGLGNRVFGDEDEDAGADANAANQNAGANGGADLQSGNAGAPKSKARTIGVVTRAPESLNAAAQEQEAEDEAEADVDAELVKPQPPSKARGKASFARVSKSGTLKKLAKKASADDATINKKLVSQLKEDKAALANKKAALAAKAAAPEETDDDSSSDDDADGDDDVDAEDPAPADLAPASKHKLAPVRIVRRGVVPVGAKKIVFKSDAA